MKPVKPAPLFSSVKPGAWDCCCCYLCDMIQHSNIPNNTCYKYDDLYCDMPYVFPSMFSYVCEHLCRLIYSKNDWVMTMFAICRPELDHFKFITVAVVVVAVVDDDDFIIFYHNYLFWFYSHGLVDKPPFLIVIIPILLFGLVILAPTAKKKQLITYYYVLCYVCVNTHIQLFNQNTPKEVHVWGWKCIQTDHVPIT